MKPSMQMLCRLLDQVSIPALGFGAVLGLISGSTLAATPASPAMALKNAVVDWVAQTQSVAPESVELAPLDSRLQVKACTSPLAMDLPFASPDTIRVRCVQPAWQLYVRVSVPGRVATSGSAKAEPTKAEPAKAEPAKAEPAPVEMRQVLVAAGSLQRGMRLTAAHVRLAEVDATRMPVNVLDQVSQVLHAELVRDLRPDTPLRSHDIRPTVLVKRGQMVLLSIGQAQGFQISARVEAMQDGRYGEQIKLKNRDSGRMLTGLVKGPNQVQGL